MDPLATPEDLASYLQRDVDTATATLAVTGASALVRGYCKWSLTQDQVTMTVDGNGSDVLSLPTLQLNSITSITVDGEILDADSYRLAARGQVKRTDGGVWPIGFDNVTAAVDHGYAMIPDDVRLVTCSVAGRYFVNPENLRSKQVGSVMRVYGSLIINQDFASIEVALLDPFRLP